MDDLFKRFGSFFLLIMLAFSLQAQDFCIEFESLAAGDLYGEASGAMPGDVFLEEDDVPVSLQNFFYPNGQTAFLNVFVQDSNSGIPFGNGVYVFPSNINMDFDFTGLASQVVKVTFDYWDGGGEENLAVNNSNSVEIVSSFLDLPDLLLGSVFVEVITDNPNANSGTVILEGPIDFLLLGGQELAIDNVCVWLDDVAPVCSIEALTATPFSCDGNGEYEVLIDFQYENASANNTFIVEGAGLSFGPFAYSEVPVTVGPFPGDGVTEIQLFIQDQNLPDCVEDITVGPVDCSSACVTFEDLNPGTIYSEQTGYSVGDLILTENDIKVSLAGFANNNGSISFGSVLVDDDFFSALPNIDDTYTFMGNAGLTFDLSNLPNPVTGVRFAFADAGGLENLQVNDQPVEIVEAFSELPFQITPDITLTVEQETDPATGVVYGYVFLEGPVQSITIGGQELAIDNFCVFMQDFVLPCEIGQLHLQQLPCNGDSEFFVELDFEYAHVGNFGFSVEVNGQIFENLEYADLPVVLGPFEGNGNAAYFFSVSDQEFSDCGNSGSLDPVNCSDQCIEFEGIDPGTFFNANTGYAPGDTMYIEDGVAITLEEFLYFNGTTGFGQVWVDQDIFTTDLVDGNGAFVSNINTVFDFTNLPGEVVSVSFAFVDGGGEENFAVNNGQIFVLNDFLELPLQTIPGFDITVTPENGATLPSGYVMVEGDIDYLTIGGQELVIDYICVALETQYCHLSELVLEPYPCDNSGEYLVDVDFDWEHVGQDSTFKIYTAGEVFGPFSYTDLPVTIGPFTGDANQVYDVFVEDAGYTEACSVTGEFGPVDCNEECQIVDLHAELLYTTANGPVYEISFEYDHVSNQGFNLYFANQLIGTYGYDELPLEVQLPCTDIPETFLTVCDAAQPDLCCETILLSPPACTNECEIVDLVAELAGSGPNGYEVIVDFEPINTDQLGFDVYFDNEFIGFYSYDDLPVVVFIPCQSNAGGLVGPLKVCDNDNADCCSTVMLELPPCNSDICHIYDLVVEPLPCTPNGIFFVELDFEYENIGNMGFTVQGNGVNYGIFSYNDLPISIGPLVGDGTTVYEFVVSDIAHPDCSDFTVIDPVNCTVDCNISDLVAELLEVTPDGYWFVVDFEYQNVSGLGFDVFFNNEFIGFYSYNELPLEILIPCTDQAEGHLTVCDNDNPNCCKTIGVELPPCNNGGCEIWDLIVEAYNCDDDGNFLVDLDFNYANVSGSFEVFGNGTVYGTFSYSDLPITLGPLAGDGVTAYEFIVKDSDHPDCQESFGLGTIDCGIDCGPNDLAVDIVEVTPNGYWAVLTFNYQIPPISTSFAVYFNGELIGTYSINDLPLEIFFPCTNDVVGEVKVCFDNALNCCSTVEVELPPCNGGGCEIWDLIVEAYDCDDDGNFLVDLDFNYANVSGSFEVFGNGTVYGTFSYADLPITLGPLAGDGVTDYEFIVKDSQFPDCQEGFGLGTVDCEGDCGPDDLSVEILEVSSDGYLALIDFEANNPASVQFTVFWNGNFIGSYSANELPLEVFLPCPEIDPLEGIVTVCFDNTQDCCTDEVITLPPCTDECFIGDLHLEASECNDDGFFFVELDFNYSNPGAFEFKVEVNNELFGPFPYTDLPITLGPFEGDGQTQYNFFVYDLELPNCASFDELAPVDCDLPEGDCIEFEIVDEGYTFGQPFGDVPGDVILTENNVPVTIHEFIVLPPSVQFGQGEIGTIFPGFNLASGNHMGLFNINASFDFSNLPQEVVAVSFDFFDGGGMENISVNGLPLLIVEDLLQVGPNIGPDVSVEIVLDPNSAFLTGTVFLEGPIESLLIGGQEFAIDNVCYEYESNADCEIYDLSYEIDCTNSGDFYIKLEFQYENVGDDGFSVFGNGEDYGSFDYDDLPIIIGPLPADPDIEYEFIVKDNELECSDFAEVGSVDCNNDCGIEDLEVIAGECNDDGSYMIVINFEAVNAPNDFFDVYYDNELLGFFAIDELPVVIEDFEDNGEEVPVIVVCINDNPNCCSEAEFESPNCEPEDEVWPGDANSDNIAHHFDVLNIGIAFGATGPERVNTDITWEAKFAEDWGDEFASSGVDYKHSDCNGDGKVDEDDLLAVQENYSLTHGPVAPFMEAVGTDNDPPFFADLPTADDIEFGVPFEIPIHLGVEDMPVEDIYGIAFTLVFDPELVEPNSVSVEVVSQSWMGVQGTNMISLVRSFAADGRMEVALTRTDQNQVSGFGDIVHFIGIIDDVLGKAEFTVEIEDVKAIMLNEMLIPLAKPVEIIELNTSTFEATYTDQIRLYPNPTADWVDYTLPHDLQLESAHLIDVNGRLLQSYGPAAQRIDLSQLPAGIYWIQLGFEEGMIRKKVVKM